MLQPMAVYSGVFPVVPTTFSVDGELDLGSQLRAIDYLIDTGAHGLCLLANFSEQFSLSDAERDMLTIRMLEHVADRVPVVVTTSHYSTRIAAERSRRAQDAGASMVMLMAPYHGATLRVGPDGIRAAFATIAEQIDIPVLVQDAPMAGTPLSPELMADLALQIPNVSYFKLEEGVAAVKMRQLLELAGDAVVGPWDGEESITLIPDLEAGATGTMPSCSVVDGLRQTWDLWHGGRRDEAIAAYSRVQPMIVYENKIGGLLATKALMAEGGIIASDAPRHPFPPLSPHVRSGLIAMAKRLDLAILRWSA
jgi:dihydrodipicolinate synthase/N-acetylneuraminate lyase